MHSSSNKIVTSTCCCVLNVTQGFVIVLAYRNQGLIVVISLKLVVHVHRSKNALRRRAIKN